MATPKQKIRALFEQLTVGCSRYECDNENCKKCKSFKHKIENNTDAAKIAIQLAQNFSESICLGLDPTFLDTSILDKAQKFNGLIKKLIPIKDNSFDQNEASSIVKDVLSDVNAFCYILHDGTNLITDSMYDLNDSIIDDAASVITTHSHFFFEFSHLLSDIVIQLVDPHVPMTCLRMRGIILVSIFAILFDDLSGEISPLYLELINSLLPDPLNDSEVFKKFLEIISSLPKVNKLFLQLCQSNLTLYVFQQDESVDFKDVTILRTSKLIHSLRNASDLSPGPLSHRDFYNDPLSEAMIAQITKTRQINLPTIQFNQAVFNLDLKYDCLLAFLSNTQDDAMRRRFFTAFTENRGVVSQRDLQFMMEVNRDSIIQDTLDIISRTPPDVMERKLNVVFKGEAGVDAGGVSREFFFLLSEMFSPDHGMFEIINERYWFNKSTAESSLLFSMLGTIVGLAIFNGVMLPVRFPIVLFKKLMKKPLTLDDLAEIEPDVHHTLKDLQQMKESGEDVSAVRLTFCVSYTVFDALKVVQLKEGGDKIDVTNESLDEYISLYVKWALTDSIAGPYSAFERGYNKLCARDVFQMFTPDEMSIIVSGEEVFDWSALKYEAKYIDGYTAESRAVVWFWEVFDELSEEQKVKFLLFSTGTDKAPVGGLGEVGLVIQRTADPTKLPVAHTCFNIFALPDYQSKEELRGRLLISLENTIGFGLK